MTLSTKAFLMFFSGTEKIDRGSKQNHYGKYVYKGCKFHSWYFISSVDESQNKDRSEILGKGHNKVGNFTHKNLVIIKYITLQNLQNSEFY